MQLLTSIDSYWFTTDSIPFPDIEDEEKAERLIDDLLAIDTVIETENYMEIRIQTNCDMDELPNVVSRVYEVMAKHNCLSALGLVKYKYKAKVTTSSHLGLDSLQVHTDMEFDWLDMLKDVKKIDERFTLGKRGESHQTFEIIH